MGFWKLVWAIIAAVAILVSLPYIVLILLLLIG
jgi:hypothetical protein